MKDGISKDVNVAKNMKVTLAGRKDTMSMSMASKGVRRKEPDRCLSIPVKSSKGFQGIGGMRAAEQRLRAKEGEN